jgi:hypothetical protein
MLFKDQVAMVTGQARGSARRSPWPAKEPTSPSWISTERPHAGPIARFGTVEEIAHTALFLAAPASGFITGITLPVDGGAVAAGAYMVEKYRRQKSAAGED